MNRKTVYLSILAVVFLGVIAVAWMLVPKGPRRADIRFAGDTIRVGDRFASLVVVLRPPTFFGSRNTRSRYGVDLVLHDVTDVGRVDVVTLVEYGDEMKLRNDAKLLGWDGRRVWAYAHTLVGLDLKTKQRVGFEELSRANPSLAQFWVDEAKFYSVGGAVPKLRLKVADARQFELDPVTLTGTPYEDEKWAKAKSHEESMKQWAEYNEKMTMFGIGPGVYFWRGEKPGEGEWFGLMTREEAGNLKESGVPTGRAILNGKTSALWRVQAREGKRVGEVEYLDAGLLREEKAAKPLRLEGPAGYLVMHQSRLGQDGTLVVTRVDMEGKKLWEVNTGIGKLDQVLPDARYLGLVGEQPKVMISVHIVDGTMSQENFSLTPMK